MKKWELLQLTSTNSESEEEQGNYWDKAQKLLKTMRIGLLNMNFLVCECKLQGFGYKGPVR